MKTPLQTISYLKTSNELKRNKYRRNIRKYYGTPAIDLDNSSYVVGWNYLLNGDMMPTQLNVIKSIIDTLVSKIAQSNVRPYFNTINGSYTDMQAALQTQNYFDQLFDAENVNKIVSEGFRDACIFDTGYVYIDTDKIEKAEPYNVYLDPRESANNLHYTKMYYERLNFPVSQLPEKVRNEIKNKSIEYCTYGVYINVTDHTKVYTINGRILSTENYKPDAIPLVVIPYSPLTFGGSTLSIVDTLYSIQTQIDLLQQKITEASNLSPANTIFLPEDNGIKPSMIDNRVGNIMTFRPVPGSTGAPIAISTPTFISEQYRDLVNDYINKCYELVGISQLSATGVKPSGVDSGIALSTLENVESDRFETQLKTVIRAYVDVAKLVIQLKNADDTILPEANNIYNMKWKDIASSIKNLKIQFSAADSLSKDPSVKLQQLESLVANGIIPQNRVAQLMELPDIQTGYNLANNAVNAVYAVINDCLEHDNYEVPSYVPFTLLKEEIINTQLSLKASNRPENLKDIDKLQELYSVVEQLETKYSAVDNNSTNVLEQEANITEAEQNTTPNTNTTPETDLVKADLDKSTSNMNGSWKTPYTLKSDQLS